MSLIQLSERLKEVYPVIWTMIKDKYSNSFEELTLLIEKTYDVHETLLFAAFYGIMEDFFWDYDIKLRRILNKKMACLFVSNKTQYIIFKERTILEACSMLNKQLKKA